MDPRLELEMTLSREEFRRLLPAAVGPGLIREEGDAFEGDEGSRRWTLRLVPLEDGRAGSLVLPRHRVEIRLEGFSDSEAGAFMARFHRGFQRGGG